MEPNNNKDIPLVEIDKEIYETLLKLEGALHKPMKKLANYALNEFFGTIKSCPETLSQILDFKSILKNIFGSDQVQEDLKLSTENKENLQAFCSMAHVDPQIKMDEIMGTALNSVEIVKDRNGNLIVENF